MDCASRFALTCIDGACFGAECLATMLVAGCLAFPRVASTSYGAESLASVFVTAVLRPSSIGRAL